MNRNFRRLISMAALFAPLGSAAAADPPPPSVNEAAWITIATSWNNRCGGNNFVTCASVSVRRQDIGGYTAIELSVTNNSGLAGSYANTIFTAVGIGGLPEPLKYKGWLTISRDGAAPTTNGWAGDDDVVEGLSTILVDEVGGVTTRRGINDGIKPGHTYVFRFYVHTIGTDYSAWQLALHGQGGPDDCSTKLVVNYDGSTNTPGGPEAAACGYVPPPPGPIPEPATVVLLATGLAGIGGFGAFRRRRSRES